MLEEELFRIWLSVGSMRSKWVRKKSLNMITHSKQSSTQTLITQDTWKIWSPQRCDITTTSSKCDTYDTLCDDSDDTCVTMHETLGMSVIHVYMINMTHWYQSYPLRWIKIMFIWCATLPMPRYDILVFFQMGLENLENIHGMTLTTSNNNMQGKSGLWNFYVGKNFGGCCSSDNITLEELVDYFEITNQ